jgi:hypothetical protein
MAGCAAPQVENMAINQFFTLQMAPQDDLGRYRFQNRHAKKGRAEISGLIFLRHRVTLLDGEVRYWALQGMSI